MLASETRKLAREALEGKWGKAVLLFLAYALLSSLLYGILSLIPFVGPIVQLLIQIPLSFGIIVSLIKLKRGEEVTYTEFFKSGFSNFGSSWMVTIWTAIKLIVPVILICISVIVMYVGFGTEGAVVNGVPVQNGVPGVSPVLGAFGLIVLIIASLWYTFKSYYYKLTFFVLADNPEKAPKEVVEESEKLMEGNRWKFFCLELSFIGWVILSIITFGIGMLWVVPYMYIAQICFYEQLANKTTSTEVTETTEESAE